MSQINIFKLSNGKDTVNIQCIYTEPDITIAHIAELPENLDQTTKDIFHIKTHYEQLFTKKGSVIKYCKFRI